MSHNELELGRVVFFKPGSYGFISPSDGGGDLFFSQRVIAGTDDPRRGQLVRYVRGEDNTGRPRASRVELLDAEGNR